MRYCRTLMARVRVIRITGTGSARWHWAVLLLFANAEFEVCAVLPRVSRFITAAPLES